MSEVQMKSIRFVRFKETVTGLWNELSLLAVGTALLLASPLPTYDWVNDPTFLFILRYGFLALGLASYVQWINNNSKWQPHFSGKWLALFGIAVTVSVAAILVAALFNLQSIFAIIRMVMGK